MCGRNGGYYHDGWEYINCRRCGIRRKEREELVLAGDVSKFCKDCKYPDFMAPYLPGWRWW